MSDAILPDGDLETALRQLGVAEEDIDRAQDAGSLALLAVEAMILTGLRYDVDDVVERTGIPAERLLAIWSALGFARPRPGERVFNETDVEQLAAVAQLVQSGVADPEAVIQLTRVLGASMARISAIQAELVVSRDRTDEVASDTGFFWFGDTFADVLEQVWRRHLKAAARARLSAPIGTESSPMAVGFADLVGFTAMSQQLDSSTLAAVVDRFESVAYATVAEHGGRVVKMIGDEVMFAIEDPVAAADCALDLADSYREADDLSDVRVGVAYGTVIDRDGDLFGPPVNLASRITNIAYPGTVLVGEDMRERLADEEGFELRTMLPRRLKHIGLVRLAVLRRRGQDEIDRRERRERRRARVTELAQGLLPIGGDESDRDADSPVEDSDEG